MARPPRRGQEGADRERCPEPTRGPRDRRVNTHRGVRGTPGSRRGVGAGLLTAPLDLTNRPERKRCRDLKTGKLPAAPSGPCGTGQPRLCWPSGSGMQGPLLRAHGEHPTLDERARGRHCQVQPKRRPTARHRRATGQASGGRRGSVRVKGCPGRTSPRLLAQDPPSAHAAILSGSARAETADRQQGPAVPQAVCSRSVQEAGSVTARVVRGGASTAPTPD